MSAGTLVHVAYASAASVDFSDQAVRDLLQRTRRANAALGVTGMLLLIDRSFFQILEGAPDVVTPLYEKIGRDGRHRGVLKLIEEPIEHRDFQDWLRQRRRPVSGPMKPRPGGRRSRAT